MFFEKDSSKSPHFRELFEFLCQKTFGYLLSRGFDTLHTFLPSILFVIARRLNYEVEQSAQIIA